MDKNIKVVSMFGIITVSLSIFYYTVIFLPRQEEMRLKEKERDLTAKQEAVFLKECKDEKEADYKFFDEHLAGWPSALITNGLKNKGYINDNDEPVDDDIWLKKCIQRKSELR